MVGMTGAVDKSVCGTGLEAADHPGLTREQLIDRILALNGTATAEFLARFTGPALTAYLEHLICAQTPRGRQSGWTRRGDSPAIVSFETAD